MSQCQGASETVHCPVTPTYERVNVLYSQGSGHCHLGPCESVWLYIGKGHPIHTVFNYLYCHALAVIMPSNFQLPSYMLPGTAVYFMRYHVVYVFCLCLILRYPSLYSRFGEDTVYMWWALSQWWCISKNKKWTHIYSTSYFPTNADSSLIYDLLDKCNICAGNQRHIISQWRHNKCHGVSNHRRLDCLFRRLFLRKWKKNTIGPPHWP